MRHHLTVPDGAPQQLLGLPDLQTRPVEVRAMRVAGDGGDDEGTFDGYACVWDVRDSYGTTFRRGCFQAGGLDALHYALLWMHDPGQPVGVFYAGEDDHGLRIVGRWDDDASGQSARAKARSGSAPGLSVGFVPIGTDPDDPDAFTACRLVETSQITARMASVPGASLVGVRSAPSLPDAQAERLRTAAVAAARLRLQATPVIGR